MLLVTSGQMAQVVKILVDKGLTREALTKLLDRGFITSLAESARQNMLPEQGPFREILGIAYRVRVNPSLGEEIKAGEYDSLPRMGNPDNLAERFFERPSEPYDVMIELLFPSRKVSDSWVKKRIGKTFRMITIYELAALGAQYPHLQEKFPIVGIVRNPIFDCDYGMGHPALFSEETKGRMERIFAICHGNIEWYAECRFAVVRL